MVRRFSDSVQVRPSDGPQQRPEAFIWKGRLYVVRGVLGQWRERRAWWRDALDAPAPAGGGDPGRASGGDPVGAPVGSGGPGSALAAAANEQQVWRVEASPGWSFAPGVYDLAHDASPGHEQWSLVRVAD
ncbi:MAG: DUF6504 family protein [Terracoccus sp.]